jgi:nicotinate-nucleotide adenylyltransferase
MEIGVFGGSFNPPHVSHVLAVAWVLCTAGLERVLVVPVFRHPFVKTLASFEDRVAMCRLAFEPVRGVEVSTVEADLEVPSLTIRTLEHLERENPDWRLRLVVGADVLDDAETWHAWDRVVAKAPLLVVGRAGVARPDAPPPIAPDVSSTEIRRWLAVRRDAEASRMLDAFLPAKVRAYVEAHGLYR